MHNLYTPEQALSIPADSDSQISSESAHECSKVINPHAPAGFTPTKYSHYTFLLEA